MTNYQKIAQAMLYIRENLKDQPELDDIARHVHTSPFHFQRLFTEWAGVSPKKFLQYLTLDHAKTILASGKNTLADAAFETGLSGTSRLHDLFVTIEGMTPGEYKNGGQDLTITYDFQSSPFGDYLVASTDKGITNLFFFDHAKKDVVAELRTSWAKAKLKEGSHPNHKAIGKFFEHDLRDSEKIKLHLKGTDFQIKVWEALLKIPEGKLSTYSAIARGIHQPKASRAVGSAIGDNPVGYIIPCHRVIRSVGGIGEYRWGGERKMAMIGWEGSRTDGVAA